MKRFSIFSRLADSNHHQRVASNNKRVTERETVLKPVISVEKLRKSFGAKVKLGFLHLPSFV